MEDPSIDSVRGIVPIGARKELLRSNIRSIMERASLDRFRERETIEKDLQRITSIDVIDPEIDRIEREQRLRIEKAKEELIEIEEEMEKEFERILSGL